MGVPPGGGNASNEGQPRSRERVRVGRDNKVRVSVCRRQESKLRMAGLFPQTGR